MPPLPDTFSTNFTETIGNTSAKGLAFSVLITLHGILGFKRILTHVR